MSRAYAFFWALKSKPIRSVLKHWNLKQAGKKDALIAKLMLHLQISVLSGKSIIATMCTHPETERYDSWLRRKLEQDEIYPILVPQNHQEAHLLSIITQKEAKEYKQKNIALDRVRSGLPPLLNPPGQLSHRISENTLGNTTDPQSHQVEEDNAFSLSEFARLLIIMRDDEEVNAAMIGMGQQLTRSQLDAGFSRTNLWGVIESHSNDSSLRYYLDMTGRVDNVDSRLPPAAYRTATFLKNKFDETKGNFTTYVNRWSASGQNDPDRFGRFLPKLASGELSAMGKRMMVMFTFTKKGTPHAEDVFTKLCCKLIPGDSGRDEGSRNEEARTEGRASSLGTRRRSSQQEGLNVMATCYVESKTANKPTAQEEVLENYNHTLKKTKILDKTEKLLAERSGQQSTVVRELQKLHKNLGRDLLEELDGGEAGQ